MNDVARSILVVPAHWSIEKLEKARTRGADRILFDLEDGVPGEFKDVARKNLKKLDLDAERELVRILDLGLDGDIPAPLVIPKAETSHQNLRYLLIETLVGVSRVEILASPFCPGILFGAHDVAHQLGLPQQSRAVQDAAARVAFAARAAGLTCWAPPVFSCDTGILEQQARDYRGMGFTGMGAIHPSQIETINRVFTLLPVLHPRDKVFAEWRR